MASSKGSAVVLVGVVVVALAAVNWHIWQTPVETAPMLPDSVAVAGATARADDAARRNGGWLPPLSTFTHTTARPLFAETRRPVDDTRAIQQSPAATQADTATSLQVLGVVMNAAAPARALIATTHAPMGIWIAVGQVVEGWRLAAIAPDEVRVEARRERRVLKLYQTTEPTDEARARAGAPGPSRIR